MRSKTHQNVIEYIELVKYCSVCWFPSRGPKTSRGTRPRSHGEAHTDPEVKRRREKEKRNTLLLDRAPDRLVHKPAADERRGDHSQRQPEHALQLPRPASSAAPTTRSFASCVPTTRRGRGLGKTPGSATKTHGDPQQSAPARTNTRYARRSNRGGGASKHGGHQPQTGPTYVSGADWSRALTWSVVDWESTRSPRRL